MKERKNSRDEDSDHSSTSSVSNKNGCMQSPTDDFRPTLAESSVALDYENIEPGPLIEPDIETLRSFILHDHSYYVPERLRYHPMQNARSCFAPISILRRMESETTDVPVPLHESDIRTEAEVTEIDTSESSSVIECEIECPVVIEVSSETESESRFTPTLALRSIALDHDYIEPAPLIEPGLGTVHRIILHDHCYYVPERLLYLHMQDAPSSFVAIPPRRRMESETTTVTVSLDESDFGTESESDFTPNLALRSIALDHDYIEPGPLIEPGLETLHRIILHDHCYYVPQRLPYLHMPDAPSSFVAIPTHRRMGSVITAAPLHESDIGTESESDFTPNLALRSIALDHDYIQPGPLIEPDVEMLHRIILHDHSYYVPERLRYLHMLAATLGFVPISPRRRMESETADIPVPLHESDIRTEAEVIEIDTSESSSVIECEMECPVVIEVSSETESESNFTPVLALRSIALDHDYIEPGPFIEPGLETLHRIILHDHCYYMPERLLFLHIQGAPSSMAAIPPRRRMESETTDITVPLHESYIGTEAEVMEIDASEIEYEMECEVVTEVNSEMESESDFTPTLAVRSAALEPGSIIEPDLETLRRIILHDHTYYMPERLHYLHVQDTPSSLVAIPPGRRMESETADVLPVPLHESDIGTEVEVMEIDTLESSSEMEYEMDCEVVYETEPESKSHVDNETGHVSETVFPLVSSSVAIPDSSWFDSALHRILSTRSSVKNAGKSKAAQPSYSYKNKSFVRSGFACGGNALQVGSLY